MNIAKDIVGKCPDCGGPTFGDNFCAYCKNTKELERRGVEVTLHCNCGAIAKERRLPELSIGKVGVFECDSCRDRRLEAERSAELERIERRNLERKCHMERYLQRNIPPMFADAVFENLDSGKAAALIDNPVGILFGNFGTGKSYAGYALARELFEREEIKEFKVVRAFRMMMEIKASFKDSSFEDVVEIYTQADLLIVDEFGKNTGSDFEESVLFEIIATRYEFGRRTLLIVNAATKADLETLVRLDVLDRFRGSLIEFNGRSRR